MNDIAADSLIIATVLATTYWHHRTLNLLRVEMLGGLGSLRSEALIGLDNLRSDVIGKLDAIQQDMCDSAFSKRT